MREMIFLSSSVFTKLDIAVSAIKEMRLERFEHLRLRH